MYGDVLEPLLAFFVAARPFAEVSRFAVLSKTWRKVLLNALKTAHQLNLSGFAESVTDEVVRLALIRVTSENLRLVNLSGCHNISPGGMEYIFQYISETCLGVKEVDVTACSNETVLRAVATRARAALGAPALDLFALLRSMGAEGKRCSFSNLGSLLNASPPLLLFDRALAPRKNALLQASAQGTAPEVAMLLSLSFAVGDDIRTFDVNQKDSQGNTALLLACGSGNFEMAAILVCAGASVSAANKRGDTPLLAAVGAGTLELAEMLVSKGTNVEAVREDGAGLLSLAIVSQQPEMLKFALARGPEMLPHQGSMSDCDFTKACAESYFDPARIEAWLRTGASPLGLAGQVGALIASCALESSTKNRLEDVRAFIFHNLDMLRDPSKWPVKHAVQQLASQEVGTVFGEKYADCDKAAGESRFITLINKREKHLCRSIHRAQSEVKAVCYSPDGSKLARAEGSEVVVCDACTGFVQKTLSGHSKNYDVSSVSFSPDGKQVASGSYDRSVKIWETSTGTCVSTLTVDSGFVGVQSISYSPAGDMIAAGCYNGSIHILDTVTVSVKRSFSGHNDPVFSVCFSPCGTKIVSGGGRENELDGDFSIRIWDAETGIQIGSPLSGHSGCVVSVVYSPDGTKIASGSRDKTLKIWNAQTGQCASTLRGDKRINCVAFSPDGKILAVGDGFFEAGNVRLYDPETGDVKSTLTVDNGVTSVAFSPDGTKIAAAYWSKIQLFDAQTQAKVGSPLRGHSGPVTQVEFAHDGATLVSRGGGTTRFWDVQSGEAKEGEAGEEAKRVLEGSMFALSKGSSREQKVGKFLITTEGDILRIFKSEGGVKDKADKDTEPVAFFRAPVTISTVDTSGEHIAVGCQNGAVLQLRAAVLLTS